MRTILKIWKTNHQGPTGRQVSWRTSRPHCPACRTAGRPHWNICTPGSSGDQKDPVAFNTEIDQHGIIMYLFMHATPNAARFLGWLMVLERINLQPGLMACKRTCLFVVHHAGSLEHKWGAPTYSLSPFWIYIYICISLSLSLLCTCTTVQASKKQSCLTTNHPYMCTQGATENEIQFF